ncbi:MAG: 50S ribosomal protein L9 [Candidatus Latescibacterota bacterium]
MKVILREDVKGVGGAGDIIEVKPGYARNFLVPRGFAFMATPGNMKAYENEKYLKARKQVETHREAELKKAEIEKISLTVAVKVGEDDRLFGSVTTHTIADLLKEKNYEINHRKIILSEPIKELGVYEIGIDLAPGIEAKIKLWVVKE